MGITEFLIHYFTLFIEKVGYLGVFLLMTLESMVAPVPSEAVMPFAGFLWFEGSMTPIWIVVASTAGSIIGSLISYFIGAYLGKPFVKRFGKYLLLNEHHLETTEKFFRKYGEKTIFISRFVPVVRHFISIPAGVGRMHLSKFIIYTTLGAGIWNTFLAYIGFELGNNWNEIRTYSEVLDIIIVLAIIGAIIYFVKKQIQQKKLNP
ncbi:MAG: DedA family protein [Patescibacteria group bacterium]|jgi:membrane protein DedA with SNARE-associated domain